MKYHIENIGTRIRDERTKRNISIEKLAEILDISPSHMGLVERGERGISIEVLVRIANTFNISVDSLLLNEAAQDLSRLEQMQIFVDSLDKEQYELLLSIAKDIHTYSLKSRKS